MNTITKSIVSLAAVVITATTALSAGALAMSNAENMLFEAEAQNIATEEWNTTESGKTVLRFK